MKKFRFIAAMCAAMMCAALFAGCNKENDGGNSGSGEGPVSQSSETENINTGIAVDINGDDDEYSTETRPIEEGDDYAINKINNRSPEGELPGGYSLQDYREEEQGKLYTNGKSRIIIRAYNYNEDLQDMAVWADNACAIMKIGNITLAQETVFEEPEDVKVCGFDGIRYDYQKIQYEFIEDENDPDASLVKSELYRFNGRNYYFYSEQDAYVLIFDTMEEDWDEQVALFEEFIKDLEITKTEY